MSAPSRNDCLILNKCYLIVIAIIPTIGEGEEERRKRRKGKRKE